MSRSNRRRAPAWLAAAALAAAMPVVMAQGQPAAAGPVDVAADPAAAWTAFRAGGVLEEAYGAYAVLTMVGYGSGPVDAEACAEHEATIRESVASAPVSIALRHAAMSCAEALGDEDWATTELAAVSALARHALDAGAKVPTGRPIQVLAPPDVYAFLRVSGVDFLYEFYERLQPGRYFPLTVAAWDEDAGRERHLRFDFIDATDAILRDDTYSGVPFQRNVLVESILDGHRETGDLAAVDVAAVAAAGEVADPLGKAAALRTVAAQGGVQATRTWLLACARSAPPGCADGLLEALLPHAEEQHAVHTLLLAFAHGEGIGVEASPDMAARLLDAASARWPGEGAVVEYAILRDAVDDGPRPAWLASRLDAAVASGDPRARLFWIADRHGDEGATLSDADRAFLADPVVNTLGEGYGLLAAHAYEAGDESTGRQWLERAADAGHVAMAGILNFQLLDEAGDPAARLALRPRFEAAAHGGDAQSARYVAALAADTGDWQAAHDWLLAPASMGNIDAILQLALIIEEDRPGLEADLPRALRTYHALVDENDLPEARRRLARLALADRGLEEGPAEARAWLLADAGRGDAESQAMLGLYMLQGEFGEPDVDEADRWLQQALDAGNELASVDYGAWLYYTDASPSSRLRALEVWEQGADAGLAMSANNLAWALCTSPDEAVADPARGLDVALAMEAAHELGAAEVDTVAACHAANGDFAQAIRVQQSALVMLDGMAARNADPAFRGQVEEMATGLRERLEGYRAGEPYIEHENPADDE